MTINVWMSHWKPKYTSVWTWKCEMTTRNTCTSAPVLCTCCLYLFIWSALNFYYNVVYLLSCVHVRCSVCSAAEMTRIPHSGCKRFGPKQYICFNLHSCWPDLHVIVIVSHVRGSSAEGPQTLSLCLIQNSLNKVSATIWLPIQITSSL